MRNQRIPQKITILIKACNLVYYMEKKWRGGGTNRYIWNENTSITVVHSLLFPTISNSHENIFFRGLPLSIFPINFPAVKFLVMLLTKKCRFSTADSINLFSLSVVFFLLLYWNLLKVFLTFLYTLFLRCL